MNIRTKNEKVTSVLQTILYLYCYFVVGLVNSITGPLISRLQNATKVSSTQIGWILTAKGVGMILGTPISGYIFNSFKKNDEQKFKWYNLSLNRLLLVYLLLIGIAIFITPFVGHFWLLILLYTFKGWFTAAIEIGCSLGMGWVWRDKVAPFLQMLHGAASAGSLVFPLVIAQLFTFIDKSHTQMRVSFILCASFIVAGIFPLLIIQSPKEAVACGYLQRRKQKQAESIKINNLFCDPYGWLQSIFSMLFSSDTFIFILAGYLKGVVTGSYSTFGNVMFQYGQEKDLGNDIILAYVTTAFWLAFTFGRFISIFLSIFLRPFSFLSVAVGMTMISYCIILMMGDIYGLLLGSIIHGLFASPVSGLAFAVPKISFGIDLNPLSTSIVMLGSTLGETIIPTLINIFRNIIPNVPDVIMYVFLALIFTAYLDVFLVFFVGKFSKFYVDFREDNLKKEKKFSLGRFLKSVWKDIYTLRFFY